jgi:branched-chain amino acid transport system substrate-binding protein
MVGQTEGEVMQKLALVVSAAALVAAMGMQSSARAADEITIGFAIAQSGWMNAYDGPPFVGAKIAIDDINAKGGVLGKKLKWVSADTKSDQTEGAKAGQAVLADGAQFMAVSCDYDMGAGAATVANSKKIIAISFCASDAKMGVQGIGPYAFTMSTSSLTSGASLAEFAWKKGWRNAYILLDTSIEYDKAICGGFRTRWAKLGGNMLGEDSYKQDDASIASQITRVQETEKAKGKIDFMMNCSYGAGGISSIRQIRAAGLNMPLGAGDSMDGDYWAKGIPHLSDHYTGTYGSAFGDDPRPAYNEFMDKVAKVAGERLPTSFAICGYSVVQAFVLAIERAKSTDSDKVLAEFNKFKDEPFAVGPTSYTSELHINLMRPIAIMGIKDGKGYFDTLVQLPEPPPLELIFKKKS